MSHYARVPRRRLAAAIGTALAVTVSTLAAVPAVAAGPAPADGTGVTAAETDQQDVLPLPRDAEIVGAGSTGFLTWDVDRVWTSFADGSSTAFSSQTAVYGAHGSDSVVLHRSDLLTLKDMITGAVVVSVAPASVGAGSVYAGAVDSTLLVAVDNGVGGKDVHLLDQAGGTVSDRKVSGLPANATSVFAWTGGSGEALLTYRTDTVSTGRTYWALLDIATGAVTETREVVSPYRSNGDVALSATHLAWVEYRSATDTTVVVVERATGRTQRVPLGASTRHVEIGLVGRWLTYGQVDGLQDYEPHVLHAVTARSLDTGATRKLLDHLTSAVTAPDGTQLVRGGTTAKGEGLYRLSPDADGAPVGALVASTGESTGVAVLGHNVPAVIDLDRNGGRTRLEWQLSRFSVLAKVTLRHVRTGAAAEEYLFVSGAPSGPNVPIGSYPWAGEVTSEWGGWESAPNGAYTWELRAEPLNGIGPTLVTSGKFTATRKAAPHDYTDNGSPDVLARDTSGRLWLNDTFYSTSGENQLTQFPGTPLGSGWNTYSQIEAAGNIAGAPAGDLVARDKDGVLWSYLGKGDGTFAPRTKIGTGWNTYTHLVGVGDADRDGRADLYAYSREGSTYLYKGTGDWRAPFRTREQVRVVFTASRTYNHFA
ncbi:VCBS repeat-containing protein [Streptomyces sp. ISL-36]|uniref:FG-GAP repeat domain-containing protein n=1 Tax=Streptomyces sp. ISL-36 TaxID=2819182 RepID=UPI001BE9BD8F|nr:VCBS repeat-containing protein [Streptomyces sp. ISL-36]MBT2440829.1 VCBS repeat-containing protein [Streptomyces sp. ISL-36]